MSFDRNKLVLKPLSDRVHRMDLSAMLALEPRGTPTGAIREVALRMKAARDQGREIIVMAGAHLVRSGVQRYLIDLVEKGLITCFAVNGAFVIHDYELSLIGSTLESVVRYVDEGQFGLWKETSRINDIVNHAYENGGKGYGHAVGKEIQEGDFPHREFSILALCYRMQVPITVHIGMGYDIIHEHPNFNGAAAGEMSYRDFLTFADVASRMRNGVLLNIGSAVMGPEVFLKALSMARNVAHQREERINGFTTAVFDIRTIGDDYRKEAPAEDPGYYFRPWKSLLVRTVVDGGESFYVQGLHRDTLPALWTALAGEV